MARVRLLAALVAVLALAAGAQAAPLAAKAPTGLHGFLLRADEPRTTTFPRTPAFAWNPAPGALKYELQLSTSSVFRESGIVYSADDLVTPVAAPQLTLPWITGKPHALYARVRGILQRGTTPWSVSFGFDVVPDSPPRPLAAAPGLLRWTPVEGADGYQVWLIDIPKTVNVYTNVLDERDFYTFHQSPQWIGTVRWRVRAVRDDYGARSNKLPVTSYGAWSSVYTSTNPAVTTGTIALTGTMSDVASDGGADSDAHRLMPGFLFSGNKTLDGTTVELYRVYVFTDRGCINTVYSGPVVGSPAYAPRPFGSLAMPSSAPAIATARGTYLGDGAEGNTYRFDGETVKSTEAGAAAAPTTTVPGTSLTSAPSTQTVGSASSGGTATLNFSGQIGAPVDLWDTSWPNSGYYWTVVGVTATSPGSLSTAVASPGSATSATTVPVASSSGFGAGDVVLIGAAGTQETATITSVSPGSISVSPQLRLAHAPGETVQRTSGVLQYKDAELAQDVCAAGRVMRFGKNSEPALTSSGALFASGLSSAGRLTSAARTPSFYGLPLVAWTPALGAAVYQVQWSKKGYPFTPEPGANGLPGVMTATTAVVLPLTPGTWWYRVRGFDYSLPTGSQAMSWSDPAKIVVTKPKFKVVGSKP